MTAVLIEALNLASVILHVTFWFTLALFLFHVADHCIAEIREARESRDGDRAQGTLSSSRPVAVLHQLDTSRARRRQIKRSRR